MGDPIPTSRQQRRGQTMLELVVASSIIALALVPALRLMRDSLKVGRDLENATLMSTLCASQLEEHLARTAANWSTATDAGNFSAQGYPELRFQVIRSDNVADGGITGALMSITAIVWHDQDGNGNWSANEPRVIFASKLARTVSYTNEASGT